MFAIPGGREGARLGALAVVGAVVYALMGRSIPTSGLLMVAVFVIVAVVAGKALDLLEGSAGRPVRGREAMPTAGPAFWSDVETAFAAIEHATTPRAAAVAATWMTPEFAARWRPGFGLWSEVRRRGLRPRAALRERHVVTMSEGGEATACVRMVLAPETTDLSEGWVEHWTFVRTSLQPSVACPSCGDETGAGDDGTCRACGAPARREHGRWVVDSIASGVNGRLQVA